MPTDCLTATRIIDTDHERVGAWMHAQGAAQWRDGSTCVGLERQGHLVAAVMYDCYNGASIFVHIAITGRLTPEWLWFVCHYPFAQLQCRVLIGVVASTNARSIRFVEHFGFRRRAMIPGADPTGDMLVYTLHRTDCRFLTRRHHG